MCGICCVNLPPFNTWLPGEQIEIDINALRSYSSSHEFDDTNIVRKLTQAQGSSGQKCKSISCNNHISYSRKNYCDYHSEQEPLKTLLIQKTSLANPQEVIRFNT